MLIRLQEKFKKVREEEFCRGMAYGVMIAIAVIFTTWIITSWTLDKRDWSKIELQQILQEEDCGWDV